MPAAAVIPAPIAYIKVVAVKKLVVGFLRSAAIVRLRVYRCCFSFLCMLLGASLCRCRASVFTLRKLECFKQALA